MIKADVMRAQEDEKVQWVVLAYIDDPNEPTEICRVDTYREALDAGIKTGRLFRLRESDNEAD